MRLSRHDFDRFEAALGSIYGATSLRVLQQRMIHTAGTLVKGLWVSYNETAALHSGRGVSLASSGAPPGLHRLYPVLHSLWHEHPAVHPRRRPGLPPACTFTDGLPRFQVERLAIYNEYCRPAGVADQLVTIISPEGPLRCISISRDRSSFTARDRGVMNLLQPHLRRACRYLSLLDRFNTQLALLVVNDAGRIEFTSDPAAHWLRRAFGPLGPDGGIVPATIRDWLRCQAPTAGRFPDPLHVMAGDRILALRIVSRDSLQATILMESTLTEPARSGWSSLTPREREVLAWVTDGKSNPEIAIILTMSRRTVEKHMEAILAKLAVETRAHATRIALAHGLAPTSLRSGS